MRYLTVAGGVFLMFVVGADIALAADHHQPTGVGTIAAVRAGTPSAEPTTTPGPTDTATPTPAPTDTSIPSPEPTDTATPEPTPSASTSSPVIHVPVAPRTPTPVTHVTKKKTTKTTTKTTHKVVATR